MQIKNTHNTYGIVTKLLHLFTAVLFITQFVLVYWRDFTEEGSDLNIQLILLHKSIGFTLLFSGLFFVIWKLLNRKPDYPGKMARWQQLLATSTHHLLYLIIIIMPLTGTLMSLLGGRTLKWFGIVVPSFLPVNKSLAGLFYTTHIWLQYAIIALVLLHITGALKHHFIDKNDVLRRMIR